MRWSLVYAVIFCIGGSSMATGQGVTSNVLLRVRQIIAGEAVGTAFTLDVDKRQYIITAKHVVATLPPENAKILLCGNQNKCVEHIVTVIRCDDPIDIAVLVAKSLVTVTHELPPELKGAVIGQDMFFVGYPLNDPNLTTNTGEEAIGFVRKGIFSAQQREGAYTRIYLDARNNRGFSGSPVVYVPMGRPQTEFKVGAVVSGYRHDITEVKRLVPIERTAITKDDIAKNLVVQMPDGTFRKIFSTDMGIVDNTGIVVAYAIDHALDVIRKSGVKGPEVK